MKIRQLSLHDAKKLKNLFLKEKTLKDTGINVTKEKITLDFMKGWLKENIAQYSLEKPEFVVYSIANYFNRPIGTIGFGNINYKKNSAEIGYWISEQNTGKGHCVHAIKIFLEKFPQLFNIKKVLGEVSVKNIASSKVLERNGFKLIKKSKGYLFFEKELIP